MPVAVEITPDALDELAETPLTIQLRIHRIIERLENWPDVSGAKPLRGRLAGCYRVRTGDYRVQFRLAGDVLTIEKIGHRDGFYED